MPLSYPHSQSCFTCYHFTRTAVRGSCHGVCNKFNNKFVAWKDCCPRYTSRHAVSFDERYEHKPTQRERYTQGVADPT